MTKTSHLNPVELIYVAKEPKDAKRKPGAKLADIAPTVLHLLGIEKPKEMTADDLLS